MEAVITNSNGDNKHRIRNPNRNFGTNRILFPYPSDNLLLASFLTGGHFGGGGFMSMPPASLSHSYPPAVSVFRAPQNLHHYRQQPPLLPLPISTPLNHQNMNNNIRLSPPRVNKNVKNRVRDHSLTPKKKSKNQKKDSKKHVADLLPPSPPEQNCSTESPDLKETVIPRVCTSSINKSGDKFSGSAVFAPSPPPSSLPLPTFSLRPKVSCKAEVSGVDIGATDNLRRLLRL